MLGKADAFRLIAKYCGGLTFVAGASALIVYAVHGWRWDSQFYSIGGPITLNLPEFVAVIILVTLPVGVCIDYLTKRVVR